MKPRVIYQTQAAPHLDVRRALAFGDKFEVLWEDRGEPSLAPTLMVRLLRKKLVGFSDNDYLLPTGSPGIIGAAFAIAAAANEGRVNVLIWDREARQYFTTTVEV